MKKNETQPNIYENSSFYTTQKSFLESFPLNKVLDLPYLHSNQILQKFYTTKQNINTIKENEKPLSYEILYLEKVLNEKINLARLSLENKLNEIYDYAKNQPFDSKNKEQLNDLKLNLHKTIQISYIYSSLNIQSPSFNSVQRETFKFLKYILQEKYDVMYTGNIFENDDVLLTFTKIKYKKNHWFSKKRGEPIPED